MVVVDTENPLVDAGLANVGDAARWSEEDIDVQGRNEAIIGSKSRRRWKSACLCRPRLSRPLSACLSCRRWWIHEWILFQRNNRSLAELSTLDEYYDGPVPWTLLFTNDGATPWAAVIEEACSEKALVVEDQGEALMAMLHSKGSNNDHTTTNATDHDDIDDLDVLTDAQITAKNQQCAHLAEKQSRLLRQYEQDIL